MTSGRVVVIGLDGATFALLKPWMDAGALPYLKSLIDRGVHGPLASSIPPATLPAWQCFMTGKNPGKHGIVWFLSGGATDYADTPIDATAYEGKTLWELLNEDGKRAAVLNVPFTFSPPRFNGIMIPGADTPPSRRAQVVHPPRLLDEIEKRFGPYQTKLRMPGALLALCIEPVIENFLQSCHDLTEYQCKVAQSLLESERFDFVMFYQLAPDRIQHGLWHVLDQTHPWHDREIARKFYEKIVAYYRYLDEQIGCLIDKVGEDATVIVVSDHGAGPITKILDLNSLFIKEGYIHFKSNPLSQFKLRLWKCGWGPRSLVGVLRMAVRLRRVQRRITRTIETQRGPKLRAKLGNILKHLFLSPKDIDWSRTKAYCQTGATAMVRINLIGREPQGVVKPEEYEALRREIAAKLESLVDPTTGRKVDGQVFLREQAYQGKYLERMPDLVYVSSGDCVVANPIPFITSKLVLDYPVVSGVHRPDGIFIAKGPALRQGIRCEGANIMDVAPTILYLLGSQVPADMDGRVLTELFEDAYLSAHPITYGEAALGEERPALELSPEDEQAILENLKGLGYID